MTPETLKSRFSSEDETRRRAAMRALLATPDGRFLFNHLITITSVYRPADTLDPAKLTYAAARRDTGLEILSLARHSDPEATSLAELERCRAMAERARALSEETKKAKEQR